VIGLALGSERLRRELPKIKDYEVRTLLLGMDALANEVTYYTPEMESCDAKIASVLGDDNAIAAANGFEPAGIALLRAFPFYRGDTRNTWANGTTVIGQGHLSRYIMHLYGSKDNTRMGVDGKTPTDILIPDGFEIKANTLKQQPTPTQAVVIFYYKKLGNVQDATLLLMHVKDFRPVKRGNRWHIGQIGGQVGEVSVNTVSPYLHSHFVLLKGDVGLAVKYKRNGKIDGTATDEYRASIGIKFVEAFC
jgi:hypothetical protein